MHRDGDRLLQFDDDGYDDDGYDDDDAHDDDGKKTNRLVFCAGACDDACACGDGGYEDDGHDDDDNVMLNKN